MSLYSIDVRNPELVAHAVLATPRGAPASSAARNVQTGQQCRSMLMMTISLWDSPYFIGYHHGFILGPLGTILRATSGILGATLGFTLLGAILGASWEPGSSWGDLGSHLWHFGSHFGIHLVVGAILGAFREGALGGEPHYHCV